MKVDFSVSKKGKTGAYSGTGTMRGMHVAFAGKWTINSGEDVDVRVIVKKGNGATNNNNAKIVVWDALDFWPQPERGYPEIMYAHSDDHIIRELETARRKYGVPKNAAILSVTRQMWEILNRNGYRTFYIPHHYQPGIEKNPIRKKASILGYEGSEKFLDESLKEKLSRIAKKFDMVFIVNPGLTYGIDGLAAMDIAISIRSATHSNLFSRALKSGVKIANCYASGTPFISQKDAAASEMAAPFIFDFDGKKHNFDALEAHIKRLLPYEERKLFSELGLKKAPSWDLHRTIMPMYNDVFKHLLLEKK